ncbi:MAG: hypothetical protein JWR35_3542 [Marmoricola sp.]|nr:hypothetical protein [Marmoricola sp.]
MRGLTKVIMGGSALSAATVGGLLAAGVFATTAGGVLAAPPAHADSLTSFGSCNALLKWYVDRGVQDVGPYGWGGRRVFDTTLSKAAVPEPDAATSSETGTNTQEAGVDEPDVAKTDGRFVVRMDDRLDVVVTDVSGAAPRDVGHYTLPKGSWGGQLLLVGHHVLVSTSTGGGIAFPVKTDSISGRSPIYPRTLTQSRLVDLDISDPANPVIVADDTYSGSQISLRQYGDTVRLVTSTPRPSLRFVMPGTNLTTAQATAANRAVVRRSTIDDWLPSVTTDGATKPLVDCQDVMHPQVFSGTETLAVIGYDVGNPSDRSSVAITAGGGLVYSSDRRLYVATTTDDAPPVEELSRAPRPTAPPAAVITQIHAFRLDGTRATYVGSGQLPGIVKDRWSLDEHAGKLRVAVSYAGPSGAVDQNGIEVLSEEDGALVETGALRGLGIDENLQAVRWFDNLAVLVTFRQVDPLYTIDLTDQDHPKALGALKIPGYSGYLHPIGSDLVLGLGTSSSEGAPSRAQAAVFDLSDLAHPVRVSTHEFGANTNLSAVDDPRAFTWLAGTSTAVTTIQDATSPDGPRTVVLRVGADGSLDVAGAPSAGGYSIRALPLPDNRVALVGDSVRLITLG